MRMLRRRRRPGMIRLAAVPHGASREDWESVSEEQQYAGRQVVVTKLASEHLCLAYARPGVAAVPVATLRRCTVSGPRQRPDMAFHRLLRAAYAGEVAAELGPARPSRRPMSVARD
jgi:nucleoside-diphosphate-sugar epimerase